MANRWTPGKDWTMISSVRGLISCCFQSSRSASPPPDDHKKHYGSNSQSFIDDKQRVTVDPPSTHSVISCSSRGSGRKRSNRNSGLDGGDSGVISEGAEAGSPQRPCSRSARHSQGSAYSYDDADTSSDSDDDVLRRYQQSMQRSQSVHSYSQSQKSQASSKKGQMTAVSERNTDADVEEGDVTSKKALLSGPESRPSVTPLWAEREEEGEVEDAMEGIIDMDTHKEEAVTYENQGFEEEKEHASPGEGSQGSTGGHSAREHTGSAGDTASGSAPDPPHDEHLFDVSDLQEREPVLISKCGSIEVTFSYDPARNRMNVTVHQARDIPTKDRGGANSTQVRLLLLPSKKVRQKTKIKTGDNPEFQETLSFKVPLKEASNMGIRFRLYGCERMRRERMIGECVIGFASFSLDSDVTLWLTLEPRSNLSVGIFTILALL
ncbi:hypothetical protein LSAT2_011892 [Lamellibrachia satsuma]|nr:hypothetical protein LSAT2_011892 [Lamellibrachia satsuma]